MRERVSVMVKELSFDKELEKLWNEKHPFDKVTIESFWELCRMLEKAGYLVGNREFIGTKSLGPFNIAYKTEDINAEDVIGFLLSTIVPILLQISGKYSFEDFYALYLLPASEILLNASKRITLVKSPLQWDLLLFIKNKNKENIYPTVTDILNSEYFQSYSHSQIKQELASLTKVSKLFGKTDLIQFDHEGRIESLV